mmetsp:Transcript_60964/g.145276  ORF Transcript_60964/g.145276 Transcript_60964/m.145276 type:complete len:275 (-) Transcript_60964:135-959(-)
MATITNSKPTPECPPTATAVANVTATTTAGGSATGSPASGRVPGLEPPGQSEVGPHTKSASQWIQDMHPQLPSQARTSRCGVALRGGMLQRCRTLPAAAPICIPPPLPPLEEVEPPAAEEEEEEPVTERPDTSSLESDVVSHGPVERQYALIGLFWTWRWHYMVLKTETCALYQSELDWQQGKEPLEVYPVGSTVAFDPERDFLGPDLCTRFALRDASGNELAVLRCRNTLPNSRESALQYDVAAMQIWLFAWRMARRSLHAQLAAGTGLHDED